MTHGMRSFGLISTTIWQSERFNALSSDQARLCYVWLHTSAKTCAGVMRVGPAHLLEEMASVETLEQAIEIFNDFERVGIVEWFRPYVVLVGYLQFNPVKTYKHAIGAFKEALALPDCEAKHALITHLKQQSGAMALATWRTKGGEPHEVLFSIEAYLSLRNLELDTALTPLDAVSHPSECPSGKSRNTNIKEKGELRRHDDPVSEALGADAEVLRVKKAAMPHPETIARAKAMGCL
jgi:hypothetical protein